LWGWRPHPCDRLLPARSQGTSRLGGVSFWGDFTATVAIATAFQIAALTALSCGEFGRGSPPKPLMEFDNVEPIKSVVAVGLGCSVVPRMCLGGGHVATARTLVRPLSPSVGRQVGLVRLRGKRSTEGIDLAWAALLKLQRRR